jgi:hypothetical protein
MAHTPATEADIHRLFNTQVYDRQGEAFAHIANVWTDENEHPYFLGIQTFDKTNHVVPAQSAELSSRGDKVRLAYDKATVQASPICDPERDLRDEDARRVVPGSLPDTVARVHSRPAAGRSPRSGAVSRCSAGPPRTARTRDRGSARPAPRVSAIRRSGHLAVG